MAIKRWILRQFTSCKNEIDDLTQRLAASEAACDDARRELSEAAKRSTKAERQLAELRERMACDIRNLIALLRGHEANTGEKLEADDEAVLLQIEEKWKKKNVL